MKKIVSTFFPLLLIAQTLFAQEAELITHKETFERAQVLKVQKSEFITVPGTDVKKESQELLIKIISGELTGKEILIRNDLTPLSSGDKAYIRHISSTIDNSDTFDMAEPERINILLFFSLFFFITLFVFGGWQGIRGLISLTGSIAAIFYVLIPGIAKGYNPILIATVVSSIIIILGSYVTHGWNKTTTAAVLGMMITVIITGVFAYYALSFGHITGYSEETSTYLLLNYRGSLDMSALLFGGIIIGLLGVLYDSAIGQAVAVEELVRAGPNLSRIHIFTRAMRIGREHIGALVNTLAIAYVGVALPLLLLIRDSTTGVRFIINSELFATEILRIIIGSVGLVLAVPITTFIAVQMLYGSNFDEKMENHKHVHNH